jgi:hypothetical protein
MIVGSLGLLGIGLLQVSQFLHVVGVGGTTPANAPLWLGSRSERQLPLLGGDQRRANPKIVLLLGQHVPDQHRELAGRCHRRHLVPALGADAQEEGTQGTARFGCGPGRLDQEAPRMAAAMLADPTMLGDAQTRLPDTGIEPEIAHQLLRFEEAGNVADGRDDAGGHNRVDAGDGQQPLDLRILYRVLGYIAVQHSQVFAEPIDLTDMSVDRSAFVLRHHLLLEPGAATPVEQIRMRTYCGTRCACRMP